MNLLFVCGDPGGGALKSTLELATRLAERHRVTVLQRTVGPARGGAVHRRTLNLHVKLGDTVAGRLALGAHELVGRRGRLVQDAPLRRLLARYVENAAIRLIDRDRPDAVIATSLFPLTWKRLHSVCRTRRVPVVYYVRGDTDYQHFRSQQWFPDLCLANAHFLADRIEAMGCAAFVVPSVIDVDAARTATTRETVVFVNPLPGYGLGTCLSTATAATALRFAIQESWPAPDADVRAEIDAAVAERPNLVYRTYVDDKRQIYADARLLFLPYEWDCRPRVVLEAQANGIPVVATDLPGLREAVGPGGVLCDPSEAPAAWAGALSRAATEPRYSQLVHAATDHAARDEVRPAAIVARFEDLVGRLVIAGPGGS